MSSETKVGIFVLFSIVLIVGLSIVLGDLSIGKKGIKVTFVGTETGGINTKADVKYLGIPVGKIDNIELRDDQVLFHAIIEPGFIIPNNVTATPAQDGLLGQKFLDLSPVSTFAATGALSDGQVYTNYKATMSLDDLAQKLGEIADQVTIFTTALNETFASDKGKSDMQDILTNLKESTDTLNHILASNQSDIRNIVSKLSNIADTIEGATAGQTTEIREIIANIHDMSENLKNFSEKIDTFMGEEQGDLQASIGNIKEITDKLKNTMDKIDDGSGTIGMLISDNETRDNLKGTINTLHDLTSKADQLVIELQAGAELLTNDSEYKGKIDVRIRPNAGRFYLIGVGNDPIGTTLTTNTLYTKTDYTSGQTHMYREKKEKTTEDAIVFDLQYGLVFNKLLSFRGGLFDSKVGFALDVMPWRNEDLLVTFQASDFSRDSGGVRTRINAKYFVLNNLFVQAGWDDMTSGNSNFTVGAGIRFTDNDLKTVIGSVPLSSLSK